MRFVLLCSLLLMAGCAGPTPSYYPAAEDLPPGWVYEAEPRAAPHIPGDHFGTPEKSRLAVVSGPEGSATIVVLTYDHRDVTPEAEAVVLHYGCAEGPPHLLVDSFHLILIFAESEGAALDEALDSLRDIIVAKTGAGAFC